MRRCGDLIGTVILTAFQQVWRRIQAPAAREKRPGKVPDRVVPVQIERRVSLSVLKCSRSHTASGTCSRVWVGVCAKSGMI